MKRNRAAQEIRAEHAWHRRLFGEWPEGKKKAEFFIQQIDKRDTVLFRQRKQLIAARKRIAVLEKALDAPCFKCGLGEAKESLLDDITNVAPGPGTIAPKTGTIGLHDWFEEAKAKSEEIVGKGESKPFLLPKWAWRLWHR